MQTSKFPYELLFRWNSDGILSGSHVQYRYVISADNGTKIGETVSPAEPLTLETAEGSPLGDLLIEVQIAAITAKAKAEAERDVLKARVIELETAISVRGGA